MFVCSCDSNVENSIFFPRFLYKSYVTIICGYSLLVLFNQHFYLNDFEGFKYSFRKTKKEFWDQQVILIEKNLLTYTIHCVLSGMIGFVLYRLWLYIKVLYCLTFLSEVLSNFCSAEYLLLEMYLLFICRLIQDVKIGNLIQDVKIGNLILNEANSLQMFLPHKNVLN